MVIESGYDVGTNSRFGGRKKKDYILAFSLGNTQYLFAL
jgi:hypothetical protein